MRSGQLRHKITIIAPSNVLAPAQTTVATGVWAAIDALPIQFQARERLAMGGVQASTTYIVTLRYRTDVTEAMVFKEEYPPNRTFQILSIVPGTRRDKLECECVTTGRG